MSDVQNFTLRKVCDAIYLVTFPTQYDVNMHFVRPQEYYESVNPKFRGEVFSLFEFMRWYSIERDGNDGTFTYTTDWCGFNVPGWVLEELYCNKTIPDINKYDITMRAIYETIRRLEGNGSKCYLMGTVENGTALDHELAHGLFYIEEDYRKAQEENIEKLVKKRGEKVRTTILEALAAEGYCEDVLIDEMQAYLATGMGGRMQANLYNLDIDSPRKITWLCKPFVKTFEEWASKTDMPWRTIRKTKRRKNA